jgi:hypothetical protein
MYSMLYDEGISISHYGIIEIVYNTFCPSFLLFIKKKKGKKKGAKLLTKNSKHKTLKTTLSFMSNQNIFSNKKMD